MTTVEAQWSAVQHLILGEDPQLRLYADLTLWQKKLEHFRKREDERMVLHEPTVEDLEIHKSLLRRLIADGEQLLAQIRQIGLPENPEGTTLESVDATLELLRADYRGWHESMPAEKRRQILSEVFPGVA